MSWAHDSLANGGLGIVDLWNETGIQGERVNIAILDTGIIDHNDFKINGESIVKQIHLVDGITSIKDSAGHGTNSAAIAAATGVEIINGIAPKANLFIVKISENTGIESNGAEIAEALKFIKDSNWPVDIISIAYSFKQQNEEVKTSIAELEEQGRIVLCALNHRIQGNSLIISNDQFPAAYGNVIPIAAYSKSSSPTPLPPCEVSKRKTNWIFPGEKILTLDKDGQTTEGNFTSIATPLAAGVFAVFLSLMKKKNIAVDRTNIDKLRSLFINTGNQKTIKIGEDEVSFLLPMVLKAIKEFDKTFNQ
jgi:serine protease AprX